MPVVQLEHPIRDFAMWKAAFDSDPIQREASGVRSYQIYRPVDDPNYIAVDLEFDTRPEAEAFTESLQELWRSPQATAALGGVPRVRIVDLAEAGSY